MALPLPPIPNLPVGDSHEWRDWFFQLYQRVGGPDDVNRWTNIDFTNSNLTSIVTRRHNDLQGLQGGSVSGTEYYHLSADQYNQLSNSFNYGQFYSTSDQFAASTGATYVVEFDQTSYSNNVYIDGGNPSRMYVTVDGVYNVAFTLQLINNSNDGQYADVWYRVNGTDVADSASRFGLPARKSTGDPSELIGAMNILLNLSAGDYVEIAGGVSSTDVSLWHDAASTTPFIRPAIPSVIATVTQVA